MKDKTIIILALLILGFVLFCMNSASTTDYAIANRYRSCFEDLSENEVLTYEQMKEVCRVYLPKEE